MTNSKNKALIIALSLIALAVVMFFGAQIYLYNTPETGIGFGKPVDPNTDRYETMPIPTIESRSIFGMADVWNKRVAEIVGIQAAMHDIALEHTEHAPYHLESSANVSDGKTIITFAGTYTENGEQKEYEKKWELDYVFTKNIDND